MTTADRLFTLADGRAFVGQRLTPPTDTQQGDGGDHANGDNEDQGECVCHADDVPAHVLADAYGAFARRQRAPQPKGGTT